MPAPTVRDLFDRAVALGLVTTERAAATPTYGASGLDEPLVGPDGEPGDEVAEWLVALGVGFTVHGEDVDDVAAAYEDTLLALAACTRGLFTIIDVQLRGNQLTFRSNGRPVTWHVDDFGDYLDHMPFFEDLDTFELPTSPLRWHERPYRESGDDDYYFFAEPVALATLAREYALEVVPLATGLTSPPDDQGAPPPPSAPPQRGLWRRLTGG